MANDGPDSFGWIFFGVADDEDDAKQVLNEHSVEPVSVGRFQITGTAHELGILGKSVDEMLRWLVQRIKSSKLNSSFAVDLAATLVPFEYKGKLVWSLRPKAAAGPVEWTTGSIGASATQRSASRAKRLWL